MYLYSIEHKTASKYKVFYTFKQEDIPIIWVNCFIMSKSDNCKDGSSTKSNKNGVCDVNDKLQNMRIGAVVSVCANCGKEGAKNICAKCKQVKYCNAKCKKVHKKKHKKECEELIRRSNKHAAELHDIELFKQPPLAEECSICFLRMPTLVTGYRYMACCGKTICCGCFYAPVYDNHGNVVAENVCPYCRVPVPSLDENNVERLKLRVEAGDPIAIFNEGTCYSIGIHGYPQDHTKALELWHRASELGCNEAYNGIGKAYSNGRGIEVDKKKAHHYYELAAMGGSVMARHNLGNNEYRASNMDRAVRHYLIAVRSGHNNSLKQINGLYKNGHATKDDYTKALQLYQEYLSEIKSDQRDKAAADNEECRYY